MDKSIPLRVRVLIWGNLVIGIAAPIGIAFNIFAALGVFSAQWASDSIFFSCVFGVLLGFLNARSGWGILKAHDWAFGATAVAGGFSLGYTILGLLTMMTSGRDRALAILIRHGSEDWWDWSFSHFQSSSLRELPLLIWWVYGLGTLVRFRLPGAAAKPGARSLQALPWIFPAGLIGAFLRLLQIATDTTLYSQR